MIWARGRHLITAGAGLLIRSSDGFLTAGRDGEYGFSQIAFFALQFPAVFRTSLDRNALPTFQQPQFNRTYHYNQYFLFAQDTYRVTSRLTANYGVRYEFYGGPQNTGSAKDTLVQLGSGSTLARATGNGHAGETRATAINSSSDRTRRISRFGWARPTTYLVPAARCCAADTEFSMTGLSTTCGRTCGITIWLCRHPYRLPLGKFNFLAPISTVLSSLPPQDHRYGFSRFDAGQSQPAQWARP